MNFIHILLTRVNIGYIERALEKNVDPEEWLDYRLKLFYKCCFPSVLNQSNKNFIWMLYFDIRTPSDTIARIKKELDKYKFIYLQFMDGDFSTLNRNVIMDINNHISSHTTHLITSRVDTDDLINRNYIKNLQLLFKGQIYKVVNFNKGLVYDFNTGVLGATIQKSNAFITLIEEIRNNNFFTVFHRKHREYLNEPSRIEIKDGSFMWCVCVHELNVSSGFFGKSFLFKQLNLQDDFNFTFQKHSNFLDRLRFHKVFYRKKSKKIIPYILRTLKK